MECKIRQKNTPAAADALPVHAIYFNMNPFYEKNYITGSATEVLPYICSFKGRIVYICG